MGFEMIFPARATIEMENLLGVLNLSHAASWLSPPETLASSDVSAFCYSKPEDVRVASIVVPENELVQVERQISTAYIVVCAHNPALQQAPEVVDVAGVNSADHVLMSHVAYGSVPVSQAIQVTIAARIISGHEINLLADCLLNKTVKCFGISLLNHLADHVSLAADSANLRCLVSAASNMVLFAPVPILVLAADVGFIGFNDAHKLLKLFVLHPGPESMAHIPCRGIGSANLPLNLKRTDALLAVEHLPENLKPSFQGHIGILKHRAHADGESVGIARLGRTCAASPMKGPRRQSIHLGVSASRTRHAFRPSALRQKYLARIFRGESFEKLFKCHHAKTIAHKNVVVKFFLIALISESLGPPSCSPPSSLIPRGVFFLH